MWFGLRKLNMLHCSPYNPLYWLERLCAISDYRKAKRSEHTTIICLIALRSAFRKTGTERHSILPIYGLFLVSAMPQRTAHCKVYFSDNNIFYHSDADFKILSYWKVQSVYLICFSQCKSFECSLSHQLFFFWHLLLMWKKMNRVYRLILVVGLIEKCCFWFKVL